MRSFQAGRVRIVRLRPVARPMQLFRQEATMRKTLLSMFAGLALLTGSTVMHAQDVNTE